MIITIDGGSGTGKSTVAKRVAEALGWIFVDTGAMYRSYALWKQKHPEASLEDFDFQIMNKDGKPCYFISGKDISEQIRQQEIGDLASKLSQSPEVRTHMRLMQRDLAKEGNVVFEGRDMGSVVFPEADYKFYLTASYEVRAERRLEELKKRFPGKEFIYEDILNELTQRDARDQERELSPLVVPEGAFEIDTSSFSIDDVCSKICQYIQG